MDEDTQNQAENQAVAEDSNVDTSPVTEPTTSENVETEGQAEQTPINETATEETSADTERKPSRAERRIRELNNRVKELEQSNQPFQGIGQSPQLEAGDDGEITREQLDSYVAQKAEQVSAQNVQFAIAQERAKSNFEHDMETLPTQYPEIDAIPGLEDKISQEFQDKAFKVVGVDPVTGQPNYALDPSVRLADIAKNYVDVARAAAKRAAADTTEAVKASADTSAIHPGNESRGEKTASEMTVKEIEEKFGYANER